MPTVEKYNIYMRVMHWLLAVCIIGALTAGLVMVNMGDSPFKWELYGLHKSFGILIFVFVLLRIIIRMQSKIPPYPKIFKKRDVLLSHATIVLFYCLMLLMPITGYLMSTAAGYDVAFFGISLPNLISKDVDLAAVARELHGYAGYAFIATIALHLLGSIKHYFTERVNLLTRIW